MLNWMVAVTVLGAFMSMYDCFDDVVESQGIWKRKLEEFEVTEPFSNKEIRSFVHLGRKWDVQLILKENWVLGLFV